MNNFQPNERGYWGEFGGRFVPETLMSPLEELTGAYFAVRDDTDFQAEFLRLYRIFPVVRRRFFTLKDCRKTRRRTDLFEARRFGAYRLA
jgi:tryptophan synthase beta subunit